MVYDHVLLMQMVLSHVRTIIFLKIDHVKFLVDTSTVPAAGVSFVLIGQFSSFLASSDPSSFFHLVINDCVVTKLLHLGPLSHLNIMSSIFIFESFYEDKK